MRPEGLCQWKIQPASFRLAWPLCHLLPPAVGDLQLCLWVIADVLKDRRGFETSVATPERHGISFLNDFSSTGVKTSNISFVIFLRTLSGTTKGCAAVQKAHPSYDELRVTCLEIQQRSLQNTAGDRYISLHRFVTKKQIHQDHVEPITEYLSWRLGGAEGHTVRQITRYMCPPTGTWPTSSWDPKRNLLIRLLSRITVKTVTEST